MLAFILPMKTRAASIPSNAGKTRQAFTLTDLLVVLGVLGILGLLLLPVMASTAERSQRARCQDNLRRIAMGVTVYAGNNNGRIFSARSISIFPPQVFVQLAIDPINAAGANSVGLSLATNGVWTCPNRPGMPVFEPAFPQYSIGYQYFGGISAWRNSAYDGPSRSPINLNTALPHWALAADAVVKVNGVWGGSDPAPSYVNLPQHRAENSSIPQGGNQAFVDGSVSWIQAEKMYLLSSWAPPQRGCYWYQDPKDFPASLKSVLPLLRFQP
jgi:competence protein ComGC